ncbi:hypothetical protein AAMO2058_000395000 [Amorphochlora amoebiformis]|uniref:Matrin-type domain-containing protein n=1 Tax=Amorphochlora amoebiformis TaxID=1561963 RepID=A0A7S0D2U3_9EUKA|mmetsp:Transcript_1810/g.2488  ORF Transcript_1810/g.2488 Transcript_1810/m.2488 type:complete len:224 (+) Transcript_1810:58-729(+)|eukprot:1026852-Amorphochlora_amoeboformis.AAC.1
MRDYSSQGVGSKPGSAGVASGTYTNQDRRERLRALALETIDLKKDPYFMKNHIGKYECKLCLTLHTNEGSYLAHTQGKRHQQNLARRAAKVAKTNDLEAFQEKKKVTKRKVARIGRPGYKVVKQLDPETQQRCLLFQISYPKIEEGLQPRHRFMSAFEQRVEPANDNFQYILFAAEPYETISFKIPNKRLDRSEGKFFTHWDPDKLTFTVQLFFEPEKAEETL